MLRRHIFRKPVTRTLKARLTSVATIIYDISEFCVTVVGSLDKNPVVQCKAQVDKLI